ncbi:MAG: sterol desaturase family protein [Planctomycetaceae bacterium]|nr:sterol desaturase family protein [Planctomycetaceae bacterium]
MNRLTQDMDADDRAFGQGWISGMAGLFLSLLGLGTVLCFWFPQWLTVEQTRELYAAHLTLIRAILFVVLVSAFLLAFISTILRRQKVLGLTAMGITLLATLMGGSAATSKLNLSSDIYLGLDFFLLNLLFLGTIFVPIERFFKQVDQPILRYEWREDLLYFLISTLLIQLLTYLSLAPGLAALGATPWFNQIRIAIAFQPEILQFFEIMFLTDLAQYWFHRTFHQVPALWKFHAVHHSARSMDWLAGSRMHLVESVLMRAFTTLPMFVLGFSESSLHAYVFFVYLMSVFIHSNVNFSFGMLSYVIATPRYHHWHHAIESEAIDKNFAVHFPILDMIFGTFHLPKDRWPQAYGISSHPVPSGYWRQFLYPFKKTPKKTDIDSTEGKAID